jgi:hypothetical protein
MPSSDPLRSLLCTTPTMVCAAMLITSPRGNLPGLPGNWDSSPGIPVKTCDKKERNKNNVHLMQHTSYISSMAPRTMLDMLVQKEMGVLAAVNTAMQSEES